MRDLPRDSGEYLSGLHNIHSLTFFDIKVDHISEELFHTCFSAFRETLTYLSLEAFATSFSAFVTVVDYFPNITTLQLSLFDLSPDEGPVPPLSRPLRGKVQVFEVRGHCLEFFDRFGKLDLAYEELVINSPFLSLTAKFLESAFQVGTSTVSFLRLTVDIQCE
jgi:hypothetical protein